MWESKSENPRSSTKTVLRFGFSEGECVLTAFWVVVIREDGEWRINERQVQSIVPTGATAGTDGRNGNGG